MTESSTPFSLRIPQSMRAMLERMAKQNSRSLQKEIISRLESTLPVESPEDNRTRELIREMVKPECLQDAGK